tara:strand:+ start:1782 stop:3434 length:1653 start_codon:yes stop_codon:yes gene_type:complete
MAIDRFWANIGTQAVGTGTNIVDSYWDKVDEDITTAQSKADWDTGSQVEQGKKELDKTRAYYGHRYLEMEENFKQLAAEFGPDKIEELNVLAESQPNLFAGNYKDVLSKVGTYMQDVSSPDISATGDIRLPRIDPATGQAVFDPATGDAADLYKSSVFMQEGITGGDLFNKKQKELMTNVTQNFADLNGVNLKDAFLGSYVEPGTPGAKIIGERQMFQEGVVPREEITQNITEILNRKLVTDPNAITRGEIVRATNWYPIIKYDQYYANELKETRGDQFQALQNTMLFTLDMLDGIEARGGNVQSAVRTGAITSDNVLAVMTANPAVSLAHRLLSEAREVDMELNTLWMAASGDSAMMGQIPEDLQQAKIKWKEVQKQYYDMAESMVLNSGFYTVQNKFVNTVQPRPEDIPNHLKFSDPNKGISYMLHPRVVDGTVKALPLNDLLDRSAAMNLHVTSFVPTERGGAEKTQRQLTAAEIEEGTLASTNQGPDGTVIEGVKWTVPNLYYVESLGWNKVTKTNKRFDLLIADFQRNDPFGLHFVDYLNLPKSD